jgi:hypothetical protein
MAAAIGNDSTGACVLLLPDLSSGSIISDCKLHDGIFIMRRGLRDVAAESLTADNAYRSTCFIATPYIDPRPRVCTASV